MAIHYLYEEEPDNSCLYQGDILQRTPDLNAHLKRFFPHYAEQKNYKYFIVLTQSCDLVCRDDSPLPKSRYITIAAVRPIEEAIREEAKKKQEWWEQPLNLIDNEAFNELLLFTESLIDNNNPNYFYIHEELTFDIQTHCCAFLALSVAIRVDNYRLILGAKSAQIKDIFRAKLGWLVGNMYSRVGTEEWDDHYGKNGARNQANEFIKNFFACIDKNKIDKAVKELKKVKDLQQYTPEEILNSIKSTKIIPRSTLLFNHINLMFSDSKFIGPIGSVLIQSLRNDKVLIYKDIEDILTKQEDEEEKEIGILCAQILQVFVKRISEVLNDEDYPNRDRFIKRLIENFKQDAKVRNILV